MTAKHAAVGSVAAKISKTTGLTRPVSAPGPAKASARPRERMLGRPQVRRPMDESASERRWWQGAVLYQLYVRSWRDTNGDGYGDLGGVIAGRDYLAWLGVDGVWLSPTMPSPDQDWGYDVSDYLGVHPELGTMADLDRSSPRRGRGGCGCCSTWYPTTPAASTP